MANKRPLSDISDSDSEWEYEYSATETEIFYATIDISSLGPNHPTHGGSRAKRQKPSTPALRTRAKKAQSKDASRKIAVDDDAAATEADNDGNETSQQIGDATEAEADPLGETGIDEADDVDNLSDGEAFKTLGNGNYGVNVDRSKIQILDLHTANPIINYLGTLYSCSWTTPLGTDIILTTEPAERSTSDAHHNSHSHHNTGNNTLYPETDTTGRYTLNHTVRIQQEEKAKLNQNGNGIEGQTQEKTPPHPILAFSHLRLMAQPMKPVPLSEEKRGKPKRGRPRKEPVANSQDTTAAAMRDNASQDRADTQEVRNTSGANDTAEDVGDVPTRARSPSPSQQLLQPSQPSAPPTNNPQELEPVSPIPDPAITVPQPSNPLTSVPIPPNHPLSTTTPIDLSAVLTPDSSHARTAQKSFLERLINAKKSLGETDEVTVYASKVYTGTGWRSQERLKKAVHQEKEAEIRHIEGRGRDDGVDAGSRRTEGDGADEESEDERGGATAVLKKPALTRREERSMRAVSTRVAPRQGYGTSGKVRRKPGRPRKSVHWKAGDTGQEGSDADDAENGPVARAGREGSATAAGSPTAATPSGTIRGDKRDPPAGANATAGQEGTSSVPNDLHNSASVVAGGLGRPRVMSAVERPHLIDVPEDTVQPSNDGNASATDVEMGNT